MQPNTGPVIDSGLLATYNFGILAICTLFVLLRQWMQVVTKTVSPNLLRLLLWGALGIVHLLLTLIYPNDSLLRPQSMSGTLFLLLSVNLFHQRGPGQRVDPDNEPKSLRSEEAQVHE